MHWRNEVDKRCTVAFSLRDLRTSKGLSQTQLSKILGISKAMYHAIERGHRKPNADTLFLLAAVYKTSMDFVYHAFCRQHIIWNFPDYDLQYALKQAKAIDIAYLRERIAPEPPPPLPKMPAAFIYERTDGSDPDYPAPKLYGQSQSPSE